MDEQREQNPFAAPRTADFEMQTEIDPHAIYVEGDRLVVGSDPVLPPRCVLSNEPMPERARKLYELRWAPSFRLTLTRRACRPRYSINRWQRLRSEAATRILISFLLIFPLIPFASAGNGGQLTFLSLIYLLAPAIGLLVTLEGPLKVVNEKDGKFWLSGCGREFLESCRAEFGDFEGVKGYFE